MGKRNRPDAPPLRPAAGTPAGSPLPAVVPLLRPTATTRVRASPPCNTAHRRAIRRKKLHSPLHLSHGERSPNKNGGQQPVLAHVTTVPTAGGPIGTPVAPRAHPDGRKKENSSENQSSPK